MFRRLLAVSAVCLFFAGASRAEEMTATLKKIDAENYSVTVTVGGEEKTLKVSKDAEIYTQAKGKGNKPGPKNPINGGLSGLKSGTEVTLSIIKSGEREIVSAIKIDPSRKK